LERADIERDIRVTEIFEGPREFLSSTGHEKPRVNLRRPLRKAKY
jgi:hypothetical protein